MFQSISVSKLLLLMLASAVCFCLSKSPAAFAAGSQQQDYFEIVAKAQASTQARQWAEAAALWQRVVEMNPVRGSTWHQLANARYQAKDYRNAIAAYEKAIELGYWPAHMAQNIARSYALLGQKEQALNWVERSLALRFPSLMQLQNDPDLKSLRDDNKFQKLVGLVDTSRMTREQGWTSDLELLRREVERKGYSPYRKVSKEQFDQTVRRLQNNVAKLTDIQIIIEMMKLMRLVDDGHSGVLMPQERPEFKTALPVQFYLFTEGLFVIAADPKHKDLLGAQVLRFGDRTVDEVMTRLDPLISRDNDIWLKERGPFMMRHPVILNGLGLIPEAGRVSLTLRNMDGSSRTVTLSADSNEANIWNRFPKDWVMLAQTLDKPVPLYIKKRDSRYWFDYLPEAKLVYFQFNSVRNDPNEPLDSFINRLFKFIGEKEVEKLVIDMRWNNGGNTALAPPLIHKLISSEKINQRGKLFVIIGRRTVSAAQNTATFIEQQTNAIFVGEPTGSRPNFVGEEDFVILPYSKIPMNVSDYFWQSSWPFDHRTWIGPEIYVPPAFEAYKANRDAALEAILNYRAAR